MIHIDNFSYEKTEKGDRSKLRFEIPNRPKSDIEKIEKILGKWAKRGLKHFLISTNEDSYKEGFLNKKNIKEITYLGRNLPNYPRHYASITSEPISRFNKDNYNVRLYIDFPKDKCFKVHINIIKELN